MSGLPEFTIAIVLCRARRLRSRAAMSCLYCSSDVRESSSELFSAVSACPRVSGVAEICNLKLELGELEILLISACVPAMISS